MDAARCEEVVHERHVGVVPATISDRLDTGRLKPALAIVEHGADVVALGIAGAGALDLFVQMHGQLAAVRDRFPIDVEHFAFVVTGAAIRARMRRQKVFAAREVAQRAAEQAGLAHALLDLRRVDAKVPARVERCIDEPVHVDDREEKDIRAGKKRHRVTQN